MKLNELSPAAGSTTDGKRKGRGQGSGNGKTGGRGHKGQKARSGGSIRPGFEGGQMPLQRRLPKRGFVNIYSKKYATVNISELSGFDKGSVVTPEEIISAGLVKKAYDGIKILGRGDLEVNLTVKAAAFSETAKKKIEAAGGNVEVV